MNSIWRRTLILVGEHLLLAAVLCGLVIIDCRLIQRGGSNLSLFCPILIAGIAYWLARRQLPGRVGFICFLASLPVFLYAWMFGLLLSGDGM